MIKRGILLILIFLFSVGLVSATLQLGLQKSSFSPGEKINGAFNYSFSGAKNIDTLVKVLIDDNLVYENSLGDFMNSLGVGDFTQASYEDAGEDPISSKLFTFDEAGVDANLGINISFVNLKSELQINRFAINITGEVNNGEYPMLPSIDLDNDDVSDWQYLGGLTNNYNDLKRTYLTKNEGNKELGLSPGKIFCEKVDLRPSSILPPSTGYDIQVSIKKNNDNWPNKGTDKLYGFIKKVNSGGTAPKSPYSCIDTSGVTRPECCIIEDPTLDSFQSKGCSTKISNFIVDETKDYFICVYQTGSSSYYTIEAENYQGNVQGWYDGASTDGTSYYDYFIWGRYQIYQTNLSGTINITQDSALSSSLSQKIENYIRSNDNCINSCIIPIKLKSNGPGKINLDKLKLVYDIQGVEEITNFVNVIPNPATVSSVDVVKSNLNSLGEEIYTPVADGVYNLKFIIGDESVEKEFNVVPIPQAVISYSPSWSITTGVTVYFTADSSNSPTGANITQIKWTFGDGFNGTGSNVTHIYRKAGDMEVKLTIYDQNGFSGEAIEIIPVQSLETTLSDNLNLSEEFINVVKSKVASSEDYVKDTVDLLGFIPIWDNALNQIILLKSSYQTALNYTGDKKESELISIYTKLMVIMDTVPQSIDVQSLQFPANIISINEIPSATELGINGAKDDFEQAVLAYQDGINIQGDARVINIIYLSGDETSFVLVKKTISSSKTLTGRIYEIIPSGIIRNLTTMNYQAVVPDKIYSWPIENKVITYTLEGSDATPGIYTRTIVVPALSDLKFSEGGDILETGYNCGDNICDFNEDSVSCPEDCSRNYPWFIIITLFLIGIAGVYYFNFYKGPWNYKEIGGKLSALFKGKPKIFKSKDEENKLFNFVKVSKDRGLNENQTKFMLKSKGWNDNQINEAIKKNSPKQKKVIKIGK